MKAWNALQLCLLCVPIVTAGCDNPAGAGAQKRTVEASSNPRALLLTRLKDKDLGGKLSTLHTMISDTNDSVARRDAIEYIAGLGAEARPLAEPIIEILLDELDPVFVSSLQTALVEMDADIDAFLVKAASNASRPKLLRIVQIAGETHASSGAIIDFLKHQLGSDDSDLVIAACKALGKIGSAARPAVPELLTIAAKPRVALVDESNASRFRESRDRTAAAVKALSLLGADELAVPVLIDCLAMEPQIAGDAATTLAQLGSAAKPALPALTNLLNRDDHGGHDVKTRTAREAASKAISTINDNP